MASTTLPSYRADIDGLRAIAVLAVVAFHASARLVPGGFAGVDIFFVISGYLISSIVFSDIERGSFSFANFYKRRIKRILPAYIAVALFTLTVSSYLLIPNDYIFYTTSLAASWAFVSNIFFSMLSWGYFGQRTEEFPLLHTWSLSVEEQFYFIYPVLLIFLTRYFRKHLVFLLLGLGVLFVALSQLKTGQVKSYFLLSSRAHELLIGAAAYFISQRHPLRSTVAANALAVTGATLMLASLFLLNRGTAFPGINSLYPCLGAALLIYSCGIENVLTPLLKNRVLVFIGLISYSLYLWHWPILVFLRYRHIEITPEVGVAAVALSFTLAFLSWKFIESPIRASKAIDFKKGFLLFYLLPSALFLAIGLYSYKTEGAPQRFPEDIRQLISSYSFERDLARACSIRAEDYSKITLDYLKNYCAFGDLRQQKVDILLMGDSHANHFKPFVDYLAKRADLKSVYHVQGNCSPLDLYDATTMKDAAPSVCQKRNADLLGLAPKFRFIALAGFWDYKGKEREFERDLSSVVELIGKAGATPVVFKDNPYFDPDLSQCVLLKRRGWIASDRNCNIPYSFVADRQGSMDKVIDKVKSAHPDVVVINPKLVMCNSTECATYIANTALYKDANHINAKAAALLAERYFAAQGDVFAGSGGSLRVSEKSGDGVKAH